MLNVIPALYVILDKLTEIIYLIPLPYFPGVILKCNQMYFRVKWGFALPDLGTIGRQVERFEN